MTNPRKIAFIRIWPSPPIAASVERLLTNSFPEYQVETIDIVRLIKRNKWLLFANILHTLSKYGKYILLGRNDLKHYFFRTTYLYKWVRSTLSKILMAQKENLAFTFQLQSMFDASVANIPHFVYTDHTMLESLAYPKVDTSSEPLSKEWLELEKLIYKNATIVFTRSHNVTQSLIEQYNCDPDKVICVYAGSNINIYGDSLVNNNYSNQNILFVGIDWLRKGGPVLVEAFERLLKTFPDARLTIVGAKPKIKHPSIQVMGLLPTSQVHEQYQRASIFCLPTQAEPFGVAFVEALWYSLPIVATNIGAIPDFVLHGKNGFLVPPNDVDSLVQALSILLENPEKCRVFGAHGHTLAETRYNWDSVGKAIRKNILPLIEKQKAGRI